MAKAPSDRKASLTNLGHAVVDLVFAADQSGLEVTSEAQYRLGTAMRGAIKAALKATVAGKQTDKQIEADMDDAIKAANRFLSRKVKAVQL